MQERANVDGILPDFGVVNEITYLRIIRAG
jgi:hypothetical protein